MSVATLAAIADHYQGLQRLLQRFSFRLDLILQSRASLPDPGAEVRPTMAEAMASNATVDALGAILRLSEWVAKIEAKYPVPGDDI